MKIFLSYASEIRACAESVNAALRAARHDVFFDRDDLPAGLDYDDRIRAAIEDCDLFLFLVSPAAVAEGHYTRTELKIARRRWPDPAGRVLPVMAEATPFSALPPYLGAVTVLMPEGNLAAEVVLAVADLAGAPARPPAAVSAADPPDAALRYASLKVRFSYAEAGRYTVDIHRPQPGGAISSDCAIDATGIEDAMRGHAGPGDALRRPPGALAHDGLPTADQAREAGTLLYQALFGPGLRPGIEDSLRGIDPQQGKGLRFVIDTTDTPELGRLPWEFLYSPEKDDFLFSDRMKPVVRWLDVDEPTPTLKIAPPLRVLIAFAAPGGLAPLRIGEELARLDEALLPLTRRGLIGITRLEHATLERLDEALLTVRPHVLHFIGHGDFNGGDGLLLLESEAPDGAPDPLTGRRLGVLLRNHLASLRLVFLNSCLGAAASPVDAFGGIAQTLIRRGVPAVIAMQFAIPDKAAIELSCHFYRYLAAGQPVDAALTSARAFLFARGHEVEWGAPALHMRSPDGHLFTIEAAMDVSDASAAAPAATSIALPADRAAAVSGAVRESGEAPALPPGPAPGRVPCPPAVGSPAAASTAIPGPVDVAAAPARSNAPRYGAAALLILLMAGVALLTLRSDRSPPVPDGSAHTAGSAVPVMPAPEAERSPVERVMRQLQAGQDEAAAATLQQALRRNPEAFDPERLGHDATLLGQVLDDAARRQSDPVRARLFSHLAERIRDARAHAASPGQAGGELRYTVRRGDTLAGISARLLGSAGRWPDLLAQHNAASGVDPALRRIDEPDIILAGERLAVPSSADATGRRGGYYHVQHGDSLWRISARMYGEGVLWPRIAQANAGTVPAPSHLGVGLRLWVPARED